MSHLNYAETKELMDARSRPQEDILLREFRESMEDVLLFSARLTGISAELAYKKETVKEKVPIHGTLTPQDKEDDNIRVMSLNRNGIPMTNRFNYKVDRIREVIDRYHLDVLGFQEVCVNWHNVTLHTLPSLLIKGLDPIRAVNSFNRLETENIGNVERGGTATMLQYDSKVLQEIRQQSHPPGSMVLVHCRRRASSYNKIHPGIRLLWQEGQRFCNLL